MSAATLQDPAEDSNARFSIFDSYICTEPAGDLPLLMRNGPDEYAGLLRTLQRSAEYFSERDQQRLVERIHFEQALLHMKYEEWEYALRILEPLWKRLAWRKAGWWMLLKEVDCALETCARHTKKNDVLFKVQWELMHSSLTSAQEHRRAASEPQQETLHEASKANIKINVETIVSPVSVSIVFTSKEAHVGEPLSYQLVISPHTQDRSFIFHIKTLRVEFEGHLKPVVLQHRSPIENRTSLDMGPYQMQEVELSETSSEHDIAPSGTSNFPKPGSLLGMTDLSLCADFTKIICLRDMPREAGDISVRRITVFFEQNKFDLQMATTSQDHMQQALVFLGDADAISSTPTLRIPSSAIRVLPKPPKLRLVLSCRDRDLFVDETGRLSLTVSNEEDEGVNVELQLQSPDEGDRGPCVSWLHDSEANEPLDDPLSVRDTKKILAGRLLPSTSQTYCILLRTGTQVSEQILQIKATYFLDSDPKTPIFVALEKELIVRRPFECTHKFSSLVHPQKWPTYLQLGDEGSDGEQGLTQRCMLHSQLISISNLQVTVEKIELEVIEVQEAATCHVLAQEPVEASDLLPGAAKELQFRLDVQKTDIEDRRPTYVDLRLKVTWRPDLPDEPSMNTFLNVPELAIPFGEPRVLATASSAEAPAGAVKLRYMIENPSVYNLQFNVMMEVSEEFAFSGSKNFLLQLLPMSRQSVDFLLLPLTKGTWISPQLRVVDIVFRKQLKIQGAEGVRVDKLGGISIWVDELH